MIKLLRSIPRDIVVAVSGGGDSMAVLDFLKRNHNVIAAFFDHGTVHGEEAKKVVEVYCKSHDIQLVTKTLEAVKRKDESQEEFWRSQRYLFLHSFSWPVVTGHTLDDCVETWIWSSMHGNPHTIPHTYKNVIRPFLLTTKNELKQWCIDKKIVWIDDPSNLDTKYVRNMIRHEAMPHILKINPGIATTIRKKIQKENGRPPPT